jgi:2-C-methyl-D-erythritol 4-phosphate cytidylyltransferase
VASALPPDWPPDWPPLAVASEFGEGWVAPDLWAIVVAGGSGSRFGAELPKQYLHLGGQRILDWSLNAMQTWCSGRVVLVVPPERLNDPEPRADIVVTGGKTRAESVRNGLAAIPFSAQFVLVHDAARPLVDDMVVSELIEAVLRGADAAIPGLPVADTMKRVADGFVIETLNRAELVAVQTPQVFSIASLLAAHATAAEATDDAALVERCGGRVAVVPGSEMMRKVTTNEDLLYLALQLE